MNEIQSSEQARIEYQNQKLIEQLAKEELMKAQQAENLEKQNLELIK